MATTSGQYNTQTLTATAVITNALKRIRQLRANGTPSAADLADGMTLLNNNLKLWETQGLLLWLYDLIQIPMVQNQYRYTLGPPDGDFATYRPLRVMEGSFIRTTCAPSPQDTSLIILDRVSYLQYSNKSALGIPNSIYYDVQMGLTAYNPAYGKGVLYVFTAPADSTRTIFLNVQRPVQDLVAGADSFDLPLEWYEPMIQYFCSQLADYYEVPEDRIRRLKQEGAAALKWIGDWGTQEWAPMYFQPDFQFGFQGRGGR